MSGMAAGQIINYLINKVVVPTGEIRGTSSLLMWNHFPSKKICKKRAGDRKR